MAVGFLDKAKLQAIANEIKRIRNEQNVTYQGTDIITQALKEIPYRTKANCSVTNNSINVPAGNYMSDMEFRVDAVDRADTTITLTGQSSQSNFNIKAVNDQPTGYTGGKKEATEKVYLTNSGNTVYARKGSTSGTTLASMSVAEGTLEHPRITIDESVNDSSIKITADSNIQDPGYLPYDASESSSTTITLSADGATVYAKTESGQVGKCSVATATQATPVITINNKGTVTAKCTQSAGYVSSGDRSGVFDTMPYLCGPNNFKYPQTDQLRIYTNSNNNPSALLVCGTMSITKWGSTKYPIAPVIIPIPNYDTMYYHPLIVNNGAANYGLRCEFKKSKNGSGCYLYMSFPSTNVYNVGNTEDSTINSLALRIYDASNFSGII